MQSSLPARAAVLATPTAQARMTRARGLHATRSRVRSDIDTSSLPERRIERRFLLFRWHRARTCDTGNVSPDSDLHRPVAWFPGAYDLRGLSWAHGRIWGLGAAGQLGTTPGASRPPGLPGVWSLPMIKLEVWLSESAAPAGAPSPSPEPTPGKPAAGPGAGSHGRSPQCGGRRPGQWSLRKCITLSGSARPGRLESESESPAGGAQARSHTGLRP